MFGCSSLDFWGAIECFQGLQVNTLRPSINHTAIMTLQGSSVTMPFASFPDES